MNATPIPRTRPQKYRKPNRNTQMLCSAVPDVTGHYERTRVRQPFSQVVCRGCTETTERACKRAADASVQTRHSGAALTQDR